MALDILIRGCSLVNDVAVEVCDLGILDGKIANIATEISEPATTEINATGLHAFAGVVDAHVHFNEPGRETWEGVSTGSAALVVGGGTSFVDMPLNSEPVTINAKSFAAKLQRLEKLSSADFALWGGLVPTNLLELPELAALGVVGFKAFMSNSGLPEFSASDDVTLLEGMRVAATLALPVAVHAESNNITSALSLELQHAGKTGIKDYLASRPVVAELEAISRAIVFAEETGCGLHIVHVSSGRAVALVLAAKQRGLNVSLETCPHYLAFTETDLEELGAVLKCAPPLRNAQEHDALWQAVLAGSVDTIGSDHSPAPPELKNEQNFFKIWGGISGVQSTLAVMLTEGWDTRKLALGAITKMLSKNPAKRFGFKNKGELVVGKDADVVLLNLEKSFVLRQEDLLYKHKQSPYVGKKFTGVVQHVLLRGQTIFKDGQVIGTPSGKRIG